jgi:uracil permease
MFINAFKQDIEFNWLTVGQVALLFVPVSIVTVCEHIGDHKNLGNIINRDLLDGEPGLSRTLIGDGVATAVSGVICGAANTTYGENVAVIGVSKIGSVSVIIVASIMSIALGFFGPLTLLLQTVPACITGGISLILYGFIASSGVKMIIKENVDFNVTKNIIVASVILVIGIGGLVLGFGGTSAGYIVSISGTAVAMILGIIINLVIKDHSEEETK